MAPFLIVISARDSLLESYKEDPILQFVEMLVFVLDEPVSHEEFESTSTTLGMPPSTTDHLDDLVSSIPNVRPELAA